MNSDVHSAGESGSGGGKLIVLTRRCGRLANRLLLFSQFVGFAEEHGYRLVNLAFHSYSGLFEHLRRDIYCQYPPATRRSVFDAVPGVGEVIRRLRLFAHVGRCAAALNARLPVCGGRIVTLREPDKRTVVRLESPEVAARIRDARVVLADGWRFRAPEYVRKHADKIREFFRPIAALEQASADAVGRLRRDAQVVIGVHVRHGDYRKWKGGKFFFPTSRYADWMRELAGQFPGARVAFLVCSNEPRNEAEFPGLTVGLGTNDSVGDLYALAKCDYIFGAQSTYSQWASFYGRAPIFHLHDSAERLERDKFQVLYPDEL